MCLVYRAEIEMNSIILCYHHKGLVGHTSLVFRLGVDREELEPEREGGLSADGLELLPPGLSGLSPFKPILSRSLDSNEAWSPFGRGEGDS